MNTNTTTSQIETKSAGAVTFFGVRVDNIRGTIALAQITSALKREHRTNTMQVFFANVHSIQLAGRNPGFRQCINNADLVLPDGSGLSIAGKMFGTPIVENLNGTDFTPLLLQSAVEHGWTVYLFGSRSNVIELTRYKLLQRFPKLIIVGYHDGHSLPEKSQIIVDEINTNRPDIVLVALGSPLQEQWIADHAAKLNAGVCIGVGGLFDFISGVRKRAPLWMQKTGIEWMYRFFQDPATKWQRVCVEIPAFLSRLLVERLRMGRQKQITLREGISL